MVKSESSARTFLDMSYNSSSSPFAKQVLRFLNWLENPFPFSDAMRPPLLHSLFLGHSKTWWSVLASCEHPFAYLASGPSACAQHHAVVPWSWREAIERQAARCDAGSRELSLIVSSLNSIFVAWFVSQYVCQVETQVFLGQPHTNTSCKYWPATQSLPTC